MSRSQSPSSAADTFFKTVESIVGPERAERYARAYGELADPWMLGLFGYEALAFFVYSTSTAWHSYINRELWMLQPAADAQEFAKVLDGAISKLPALPSNRLVYRGYTCADVKVFAEDYEVGSAVTFHGFTSATFQQREAFGGNVLFIITPKNARAVWHLAADYLSEEVLFPSG